jgi:hypothetical protein
MPLLTLRPAQDGLDARGLGHWVKTHMDYGTLVDGQKGPKNPDAKWRRSVDADSHSLGDVEARGVGKYIGKKVVAKLKYELPFRGVYPSRRSDEGEPAGELEERGTVGKKIGKAVVANLKVVLPKHGIYPSRRSDEDELAARNLIDVDMAPTSVMYSRDADLLGARGFRDIFHHDKELETIGEPHGQVQQIQRDDLEVRKLGAKLSNLIKGKGKGKKDKSSDGGSAYRAGSADAAPQHIGPIRRDADAELLERGVNKKTMAGSVFGHKTK